jgi:hypothetical protein
MQDAHGAVAWQMPLIVKRVADRSVRLRETLCLRVALQALHVSLTPWD